MSQEYTDMLVSDLTCDDVIKCQKARRSLVEMGHEAIPILAEALENKYHWVRWEAAKALSQIGDPTATDVLIKALLDKEFDVRWIAAEGLIAIGQKALAPLLKAVMDNPKSLTLQEGAHHILHDMNKGSLINILKPVIDALEDGVPSLAVPLAARKALESINAESKPEN